MSAVAVSVPIGDASAVAAPFAIACQAIVRLHDHCVSAHESLMRPADGSSPLQMIDRAEDALGKLETRAGRSAAWGYAFAGGGLLLVNPSAHAILGRSTRRSS